MNPLIKKISHHFTIKPSYITYRLFHRDKVVGRTLTQSEIALAKTVFHNLIDYTQVKIFNMPYVPWQPDDILIAPNGSLYVNNALFCDDYSTASMAMQGVFIHELAHILQYQRGENVILKGVCLQSAYYLSFKKYNPYQYTFVHNKPFRTYNIEQQGDIARDIFFNKVSNIIS